MGALIMRFSPEILVSVFESLDSCDFMDVRLACKSFDQAAVPHLFDRVYISDKRANLKIAELVVQRFRRHVRTLRFSSVHYEDSSSGNFRAKMRRRSDVQSKYRSSACFDQHVKHALKRYTERHAEWLELHESGEFTARLCLVLSKISGLRTIVITRFRHGRIRLQKDLEPSNSRGTSFVCLDTECKLGKHLFKIETVPGLETKGSKSWHALMLALSVTKTSVKAIMSNNERGDHPLPCSAFDMSQTQAVHLQESFRRLKKLQLTLTEQEYGSLGFGRCSYASGNIAKIFSAANHLEQLEICTGETDESPTQMGFCTRFQAFFKGCTFPKLQSLILSCMESIEDEMIEFLAASPGIEKLWLHSYDLSEGLWGDLVERIKALLNLKTVSIPTAYLGLPEHFIYVEYWGNGNIVEDFFLRNGVNPFTKEALEKRLADSPISVGLE